MVATFAYPLRYPAFSKFHTAEPKEQKANCKSTCLGFFNKDGKRAGGQSGFECKIMVLFQEIVNPLQHDKNLPFRAGNLGFPTFEWLLLAFVIDANQRFADTRT
jgi:hypothetical protein